MNNIMEYGNPLINPLTIEKAQSCKHAINLKPQFKLLEYRYLNDDKGYSELIIVNVTNDGIPTKTTTGIRYTETLALRFYENSKHAPEVRILREDFPDTIHRNSVPAGDPAYPCIYEQKWSNVERHWTPSSFLSTILWWFAEVSNGTLHQTNQPVEQFYFRSHYSVFLPHDFNKKVNNPDYILLFSQRYWNKHNDKRSFAGQFAKTPEKNTDEKILSCLFVETSPIVHGEILNFPSTLGGLSDQLNDQEISLLTLLQDSMGKYLNTPVLNDDFIILILRVPVKRSQELDPEAHTEVAFLLSRPLLQLGKDMGFLSQTKEINPDSPENNYLHAQVLEPVNDWKTCDLLPANVYYGFNRQKAQEASGITKSGPSAILAGAGSLGSAMANLWFRSGWGNWKIIDPDILLPHNLARHIATDMLIGTSKSFLTSLLLTSLYPDTDINKHYIHSSITDFENDNVTESINEAEFLVDASTTLNVPRDLSVHNTKTRMCSAFFTPNGRDAVLLMESQDRSLRLDSIEAQYYRAIIKSDWGQSHLEGHKGEMMVGAGCRDTSFIIENEIVTRHAATLAHQIRLRYENPDAQAGIWRSSMTGEMKFISIPVVDTLSTTIGEWTLIWDTYIQSKVKLLRKIHEQEYNSETGGILFGYFDMKLKRIYIIDAQKQPSDSRGSSTGFTRGLIGLNDAVKIASNRTANIARYIGEWHSHIHNVPPKPSRMDEIQLDYLSENLAMDGLPALMLIVSENRESWQIKDNLS